MQQRSMIKLLVLTLVTLGIYQVYWTYATRQELAARGQDVPRFVILMAPLLALLGAALLAFINAFVFSKTSGGSGAPMLNVLAVLIGVIGFLAAIPIALWWYYKYCQAAQVVTNGQLGFDLSYILFLVTAFFGVSYVWPFIVQYHFNQYGQGAAPSSKAPIAPTAV